jgi:hypothetical protein
VSALEERLRPINTNSFSDTYSGLAYSVTELNCTKQIPYHGAMVEDQTLYSCDLPTTNVSGYPSYDLPTEMPHTSYVHSCMMNSLNSTFLVLKNLELDTYQSYPIMASFTIYNPGPADEYWINNVSVVDDGLWHSCDKETKAIPWQLKSCEYLLDPIQHIIGFKLQWYCDDRDPLHP